MLILVAVFFLLYCYNDHSFHRSFIASCTRFSHAITCDMINYKSFGASPVKLTSRNAELMYTPLSRL